MSSRTVAPSELLTDLDSQNGANREPMNDRFDSILDARTAAVMLMLGVARSHCRTVAQLLSELN